MGPTLYGSGFNLPAGGAAISFTHIPLLSSSHWILSQLTSTASPPLSSQSPVPPPFISLPCPPPSIDGWANTSLCSAVYHLRSGLFKLGLNPIFFFSPSSPQSWFQFRSICHFFLSIHFSLLSSEIRKPESRPNVLIVF